MQKHASKTRKSKSEIRNKSEIRISKLNRNRICAASHIVFRVSAVALTFLIPAPTFAQYDPKFDEDTLRRANLSSDSPALLKFFQARTLSDKQIEQLAAVVDQLGDSSYVLRTKAAAQLLKYGNTVKPLLVKAMDEQNLEVARRAELCLRKLDDASEVMVASSAARLLGNRKPANGIETLLAYVPFATDSQIVQAVRDALPGMIDPLKPPQILLESLDDENPVLRGVAAEAIIHARVTPLPKAALSLLKDPSNQVRLRVALALLEIKEKQAVPVLIDLLPRLSAADVWQAEDALFQLAGGDAPKVHLGTALPPDKVAAAWQDWWTRNEAQVDMTRFSTPAQLMGLTLIAKNDNRGTTGRVVELTRDKQKSWEITGLRYPIDAQVVGPNRVLIAEYLNRQVTERDFTGNILWQKQVLMPIRCQRLRNGDTFIATRRQLLIVDRDGNDKFSYDHTNTSIMAAERLRDGRIVMVSSGGILEIMDPIGKVQKRFQVDPVYSLGSNIEALPNGRFLLPLYSKNQVAEYNADGQIVWKASVPSPSSATRLPNGNTLVVSLAQQRVVELNADGVEVWTCGTDGRPWRARRR